MKIRLIEIEADKDELKASSTLGEQASLFLKRVLCSMNGYDAEDQEEETEDDND